MTKNIYLLAFGTFGNPYGFRQSFFEIDNETVAKSIKTFDLNTNAIKLFPNSTLYSIRKEIVNGLNSIAYSKYTFAKEQNSDRGGTFIGSGILFTNEIADENITINKLNEFHKLLVEKNVKNDILTVNHSDNFSVVLPKDFEKIRHNLKKIEELNNFNSSNRNLLVYCDIKPDKLQKLFNNSIDLLNTYDCIYFTSSDEVATFVHQKGIFELAKDIEEFNLKTQNLKEKRLKKMQSYIKEFEDEKAKLEEDRKKQIRDYREEINRNEKIHHENNRRISESKQKIHLIEQKYNQFSQRINETISLLKSGKRPEEIRLLHNEQKREFVNSIYENTRSFNLSSISNPQSKTDFKVNTEPNWEGYEIDNNHHYKKRRQKKPGLSALGALSIVLFLLWVCTMIYFLLFND